jgi:hypothetical protein
VYWRRFFRFEAGALTARHAHPLNQTRYATVGCALVRIERQAAVEAAPALMNPQHERNWTSWPNRLLKKSALKDVIPAATI